MAQPPCHVAITFDTENRGSVRCQLPSKYSVEQFSFWLRTGRNADNLAGRIGKPPSKDWLHPKTYNDYLMTIQGYLLWAIERYSRHSEAAALRQQIAGIRDKVRAKFEALVLGGRTEVDMKGLEAHEIGRLLEALSIGLEGNPFRQNAQRRNWLIVNILLETGLRRGELLKLKTTDLHEIENQYYLVVKRRPDDPTDSRAIQPAQKTSSRTVSISEGLYSEIEKYILTDRRPIKNGKRLPLKHQFLITSERGGPLSQTAVNYAFDVLSDTCFRHTKTKFHPHLLRNTFCNNYLQWCVEKCGMELERALDELRQICGWSLSSKMPLRYAAKWVAEQANEHNRNRVNKAWAKSSSRGSP